MLYSYAILYVKSNLYNPSNHHVWNINNLDNIKYYSVYIMYNIIICIIIMLRLRYIVDFIALSESVY